MTIIVYFLIIIAIAYGIGNRLLNLLIKGPGSLIEDFVFSTGLGLGIIGYTVYIIGSIGFLYWYCVLAMFLIYALLAFRPLIKFLRCFKFDAAWRFIRKSGLFEKVLMLTIVAIPLICLFGALAPETGNDTLAYHLYHPKVFIENHKIACIPFTRESLWPYLTEMLFTIGLLFKSVAMAKLFHYFFGILSALSVYALTKRFFGKKEALFAATLFYSAPGIFMQSVYSYVDLSLCFYSLVSLYSLILWDELNDPKVLILSGIFTGLALSVKLLGGLVFITLGVIILFIGLKRKASSGSMAKNLFIFCAAVFLCSFVWYMRSWIVLKNPVYPFLNRIFGRGWDDKLGEAMGVRRDLVGLLRLPWDMVMNVRRFGNEQIGVVFLMLLPCLASLDFKENRIRIPLIFLLLYTLVWFIVDQNVRFAFVIFAVVYILIGVGFYKIVELYRLNIAKVLIMLCMLFSLSLCFYHNLEPLKFAFGFTNEEEYLLKKERSYLIAKFVNENIPEKSKLIIAGEPRVYYFNRNILIYDIWKKEAHKDIGLYVNELKNTGKPVYLLYRDSADYPELKKIILNKKLIQSFYSNLDLSEQATYYLYKL